MNDTIALEYLGRCPRTFELPIPFSSASERTGAVTCNPIGLFPAEDALRALEIAPGAFRRVDDGVKDGKSPSTRPPLADGTSSTAPPITANETPGQRLARDLQYKARHKPYAAKGIASMIRKKHFPEEEVVQGADGKWYITPPSPVTEPEGETTAIPAEAEGREDL